VASVSVSWEGSNRSRNRFEPPSNATHQKASIDSCCRLTLALTLALTTSPATPELLPYIVE
jgi:hypothetical protein